MASDTVEIKYWVQTNMIGSKVENTVTISASEWYNMSVQDEFVHECMLDNIEWDYEVG